MKTNAGDGVYRFMSTNDKTSTKWPSRAAANASLQEFNYFAVAGSYFDLQVLSIELSSFTHLPLVKHDPLPAPKELSATVIGIKTAANPRIRLPQVCQGELIF